MIEGRSHGGFPRLSLDLPVADTRSRPVEILVDSGFEGDVTLPPQILSSLEAEYVGEHPYRLADMTFRSRPVYRIFAEWMGEKRDIAVVAMDGNPLLGVGLLRGNLVQIEMDER